MAPVLKSSISLSQVSKIFVRSRGITNLTSFYIAGGHLFWDDVDGPSRQFLAEDRPL